jgi:tetratricopeptide (TPR) repeat protein
MIRPLLILSVLTGLFCGVNVLAQPGDELERYEKFAQRLKVLDAQISQTPDKVDLYFQRGLVYLDMFSGHPQIVEFRGIVYATEPGNKALADLNRAIEIESRGEFYTARGRYYQGLWGHKVNREAEGLASLEKIKRLFWEDESFNSAVNDYQIGLGKGRNSKETAEALSRLAWIYRSRAMSLSSYLPAKTVLAAKQTRLVFDDYDRSIEFTKKYLDASIPAGVSMIRDIYLDKARAAIEFEDYSGAIGFLGDGIKAIRDMNSEDSENACYLYLLRGDTYAKSNDLDAAVRDYTYPIDNKYVNCMDVYEKRGDAYATKSEWQPAIKDYTRELSHFAYTVPRLLMKRGKAYLKSGEAGKAVADFNQAMQFSTCAEHYRLRGQAHRLLKEDRLAEEDEQKAIKYGRGRPNDPCGLN